MADTTTARTPLAELIKGIESMAQDAFEYRRGEAADIQDCDDADQEAVAEHAATLVAFRRLTSTATTGTTAFFDSLYMGMSLTCIEAEDLAELIRFVHGDTAAERSLYCHSCADDDPEDLHFEMPEPGL